MATTKTTAAALVKEQMLRLAVVQQLANNIDNGSFGDWQSKTCRLCHTERSVHLDFAAKTFRTLDQVWLPSDVENVCIHCKAAHIAARQTEPDAMAKTCQLLTSWVIAAGAAGTATVDQTHVIQAKLLEQNGCCAACKTRIGNLRMTNDPRRFLSIPQRVRYGVRLLQDEIVGVQETVASAEAEAASTFQFYHLRCRQPGTAWITGPTRGDPDQADLLSQLVAEAQEAYEAFLASDRHRPHLDERAITQSHRRLQRFFMLHTSASQLASRWHKWIREDRDAMRQVRQDICEKNNDNDVDNGAGVGVDHSYAEEEQREERERAEEEEEEEQQASLTTPAAAVAMAVAPTRIVTTDDASPLWKRLCQGARGRSRRRGAGHMETLVPSDVHACWTMQKGLCAKCHIEMAPETVSVNRICTARMNNIYGQGNCNLMHAACNMADAPNNLEEWLRGIILEFSTEAHDIDITSTASSSSSTTTVSSSSAAAAAAAAAVVVSSISVTKPRPSSVPVDLRNQLDEWQQKWQRKRNALLRNVTRVQKTPGYAQSAGKMDDVTSSSSLATASAIYDVTDSADCDLTVILKIPSTQRKTSSSSSSSSVDPHISSQSNTRVPSDIGTGATLVTLKRRRRVHIFS